jgi:hypothetical protein
MDTQSIVITCIVASILAVLGFVAHRRLAGSGQHPGCVSMIAFVVAWLALLLAIVTGGFLLTVRAS